MARATDVGCRLGRLHKGPKLGNKMPMRKIPVALVCQSGEHLSTVDDCRMPDGLNTDWFHPT
jgi:hypothetical protein